MDGIKIFMHSWISLGGGGGGGGERLKELAIDILKDREFKI